MCGVDLRCPPRGPTMIHSNPSKLLQPPRTTTARAERRSRSTLEEVEIRMVHTRRELTAFIRVPWTIYAQDPAWVPPLMAERREFLDRRKHPFYQFGDAVQFLAHRSGEFVGRVMASDDPHYNQEHADNMGCFGMFESI